MSGMVAFGARGASEGGVACELGAGGIGLADDGGVPGRSPALANAIGTRDDEGIEGWIGAAGRGAIPDARAGCGAVGATGDDGV